MSSAEMDVQRYLSRIGYTGPVEVSLDVLRSIHTCHVMSVPFENLTTHSGGRVQLDLPLLYDKIVNQRRGGFCYEMNGLFSWLLSKLGFQVTLLSAQVKSLFTGRFGLPFDHMILMVTLDERRWLCDVAFGVRGFSTPLSLETSGPQEQGHRVYRIREDEGMLFLDWRGKDNGEVDGDWAENYKFTLEPRCREDYAEMCLYHQTSPSSVFFCKSVCMIFKPGGCLKYVGRRLTTTTFPDEERGEELKTTTREVKDEEIQTVLAEHFGIVLNSPLIPKDDSVPLPAVMY